MDELDFYAWADVAEEDQDPEEPPAVRDDDDFNDGEWDDRDSFDSSFTCHACGSDLSDAEWHSVDGYPHCMDCEGEFIA